MFATETEKKLTKEYLEKGYIIRTIDDVEALDWIRNQFACLIIEALPEVEGVETKDLLNDIHKYVPVSDLNNFRLKIIQKINSINGFREMYFRVARNYLDILVGNELAMQLRINLSIHYRRKTI